MENTWYAAACVRVRIHEYTNTRIHEYTNTRIHEYTNTRIHEYTNTRIHGRVPQSPCRHLVRDHFSRHVNQFLGRLLLLVVPNIAHRAIIIPVFFGTRLISPLPELKCSMVFHKVSEVGVCKCVQHLPSFPKYRSHSIISRTPNSDRQSLRFKFPLDWIRRHPAYDSSYILRMHMPDCQILQKSRK